MLSPSCLSRFAAELAD